MKKLYKSSIIIPVFSIYLLLIFRLNISISEIGLYIEYYTLRRAYIVLSVLWLCCSPFRKSCEGKWIEIIFHFVPLEVLLLFIFAQWHFAAAVLISVLLLGITITAGTAMHHNERRIKCSKKKHLQNRHTFRRFALMTMFFFYAVPCYMAVFVYQLQAPVYQADPKIKEAWIIQESTPLPEKTEQPNPYQTNLPLLLCFTETNWDTYTVKEKITFLQELADVEANLLSTPAVPITTRKLEAFTLGAFSNTTNEIWIDIEHLAKSDAEKCVKTVCHEMYHAYQYYLVSQIDWSSNMAKMPYFSKLREWKENQENYKEAASGFEEYQKQPIEAAARAYAENEWRSIKKHLQNSAD